MKKIWKFVIGGIENKIFNLVLVTFLTVAGVYMSVIWFQSSELASLVSSTNSRQQESIRDISDQTMQSMIDSSLARMTNLNAMKIDETFQTLESHVWFMNDYASRLLANPQNYESISVSEPDPDNAGITCAQILYDENVDRDSASIRRTVGLLGNMANLMETLYNNFYNLNSCFIGTDDGVMMIIDDKSDNKFDENGKLLEFPFRERGWYKNAEKIGGVQISEIGTDYFSDQAGIVCSVPVVVDGKVVAVVGADFYLENIKNAINSNVISGGFSFLVNQQDDIILSSESTGFFPLSPGDEPEQMSGTKELMNFIHEALKDETGVKEVRVGNDTYYMCGKPMNNVSWAAVTCMSKEVTDLPLKTLYYEYKKINQEAEATFRSSISQSRLTLVVLLVLIFLIGLVNAIVLSRRIVKPLARMTKEIGEMAGHEFKFRIKDDYKTGDEIEVLAESFADLSQRMNSYIDEVKTVTAENERIGAEFHLARQIQASVLPDPYTAFENRRDFEIYASMDPAKEVGGDFYDFFLIDDTHLAMVIADVSGKGVPAALFMMISKALIKNRLLDGDSPGEALANVNRQLAEGNTQDMFVTVWCAVLDTETGEGIAANGGHEHPALKRKDGLFELIKYRHSPALGMMSDLKFTEHSFNMNPGDALFVYTDGVPEAANVSLEQFGNDRLIDALNTKPDAGPQEIVYNVSNAVGEFYYGADQFDDITMLCLTYHGKDEIILDDHAVL